jgi:NAD(P)H-dependent FMN reductase
MTMIFGLSGSLRRASFNAGLLRAAAGAMPQGARLETGSIAGVPLYNADDEAEKGIPPAVARLKDSLAQADGLLLVTPEYNNGIPGVFKNAIDWMSRPDADIARLHGPIGLYIGSRTPPEIAISILAEITAIKYGVPAEARINVAIAKARAQAAATPACTVAQQA